MTQTKPSSELTECSICHEPAHASETDDLDRHPACYLRATFGPCDGEMQRASDRLSMHIKMLSTRPQDWSKSAQVQVLCSGLTHLFMAGHLLGEVISEAGGFISDESSKRLSRARQLRENIELALVAGESKASELFLSEEV